MFPGDADAQIDPETNRDGVPGRKAFDGQGRTGLGTIRSVRDRPDQGLFSEKRTAASPFSLMRALKRSTIRC
jgi:hypothetical protein